MVYTYPVVNGAGQDVSTDDVHHFLKSPTLVARRIAELSRQRFISDFLLQGRYNAEGGGISYLLDDGLYSNDEPEGVQAGSEYPLTTASEGTPEQESTEKEGQDSEVYDESIARLKMDPVNRTLTKMVNRMVRRVDGKNLAKIASEATRSEAATSAWTTAEAIVEDIVGKAGEFDVNDVGLDANAVVLKPTQFAKVAAYFIKADMAANGIVNSVTTGAIPNVLGLTWVTSKHVPFTDPFLIDAAALGGIGLEDLRSPGYTRVAGTLGIESKVQRLVGSDDRDGYRLRVRRVGLAAIIEPNAILRITDTEDGA